MNALAIIETLTPAIVFVPGGVEGIIAKLETEVRSIPRDVATDQGREAIRSLAYKVARSKTALDEMGKDLVAEIKKKSGAIDAERRVIRDRLDALRDEVRAPLTAWEEAEKDRVEDHERELVWLVQSGTFATSPTAEMIRGHLSDVSDLASRDWQEFKERADTAIADAKTQLEAMLATVIQAEADAAELAELRRIKAERDAADIAAAEAQAVARREALLAEQIRRDQEAAVARATAAAEAKAAADLAKAEQATRDAEAATARAVEAERQRVAAAAAADQAATAKREANKKHRAKINNEALAALKVIGLSDELGVAVVSAIARGEIPHVSIAY